MVLYFSRLPSLVTLPIPTANNFQCPGWLPKVPGDGLGSKLSLPPEALCQRGCSNYPLGILTPHVRMIHDGGRCSVCGGTEGGKRAM